MKCGNCNFDDEEYNFYEVKIEKDFKIVAVLDFYQHDCSIFICPKCKTCIAKFD